MVTAWRVIRLRHSDIYLYSTIRVRPIYPSAYIAIHLHRPADPCNQLFHRFSNIQCYQQHHHHIFHLLLRCNRSPTAAPPKYLMLHQLFRLSLLRFPILLSTYRSTSNIIQLLYPPSYFSQHALYRQLVLLPLSQFPPLHTRLYTIVTVIPGVDFYSRPTQLYTSYTTLIHSSHYSTLFRPYA